MIALLSDCDLEKKNKPFYNIKFLKKKSNILQRRKNEATNSAC